MFKPSAPSTTTEPCNPLTVTDAEMPDASPELTVVESPFDGRGFTLVIRAVTTYECAPEGHHILKTAISQRGAGKPFSITIDMIAFQFGGADPPAGI